LTLNVDLRFERYSSLRDINFAQSIYGIVPPGNLDLFAAEAAPTIASKVVGAASAAKIVCHD